MKIAWFAFGVRACVVGGQPETACPAPCMGIILPSSDDQGRVPPFSDAGRSTLVEGHVRRAMGIERQGSAPQGVPYHSVEFENHAHGPADDYNSPARNVVHARQAALNTRAHVDALIHTGARETQFQVLIGGHAHLLADSSLSKGAKLASAVGNVDHRGASTRRDDGGAAAANQRPEVVARGTMYLDRRGDGGVIFVGHVAALVKPYSKDTDVIQGVHDFVLAMVTFICASLHMDAVRRKTGVQRVGMDQSTINCINGCASMVFPLVMKTLIYGNQAGNATGGARTEFCASMDTLISRSTKGNRFDHGVLDAFSRLGSGAGFRPVSELASTLPFREVEPVKLRFKVKEGVSQGTWEQEELTLLDEAAQTGDSWDKIQADLFPKRTARAIKGM